MIAQRIILKNWRNFQAVDVGLREVSYIVGPNAAGKSNLLDVFRFLRDVCKPAGGGLQAAVAARGGVSRIRCLRARKDTEVRIEVHLADSDTPMPPKWKYVLGFKYEGRGAQRPIVSDEQVWRCDDPEPLFRRPTGEDKANNTLLTQSWLQDVQKNGSFRDISDFFADLTYLHLVPQLLKFGDQITNAAGRCGAVAAGYLMRWIDVATEDSPSTAGEERLVAEMPDFSIGYMLGEKGNGYLRQRMASFRQMAFTRPVLILTDLDRSACPLALVGDWMGGLKCLPGMIFRVVVRAIEAWLLADHEAMAWLLGSRAAKELPSKPDETADPKATLVGLARKARREVRLYICPAAGSQSLRGVNYNNRLTEFIATRWDPASAALRSPSLRRARARLAAPAAGD